ncbi:hypothetical protein KCP73_20540 [Salmonella enterica subsp. enterica]|nr:hypothetical protein KCP73_20540 [Salmonella enterica subsp. enterica]
MLITRVNGNYPVAAGALPGLPHGFAAVCVGKARQGAPAPPPGNRARTTCAKQFCQYQVMMNVYVC